MAHKKNKNAHHPVPPANRPHQPGQETADSRPEHPSKSNCAFSEQDPKRRLGDFTGAGEHSLKQPGGRQGPNR
jgi:hypothetical protein